MLLAAKRSIRVGKEEDSHVRARPDRQPEPKRGPLAGSAAAAHLTAMPQHDATHNRQPDAGAFERMAMQPKKGLEDIRRIAVETDPVVRHLDSNSNITAVGGHRDPRRRRGRRELERIADQVHEHLPDQRFIGNPLDGQRSDVDLGALSIAARQVHDLDGITHDAAEVDRSELQRRLPGLGVLHQRGHEIDRQLTLPAHQLQHLEGTVRCGPHAPTSGTGQRAP